MFIVHNLSMISWRIKRLNLAYKKGKNKHYLSKREIYKNIEKDIEKIIKMEKRLR